MNGTEGGIILPKPARGELPMDTPKLTVVALTTRAGHIRGAGAVP